MQVDAVKSYLQVEKGDEMREKQRVLTYTEDGSGMERVGRDNRGKPKSATAEDSRQTTRASSGRRRATNGRFNSTHEARAPHESFLMRAHGTAQRYPGYPQAREEDKSEDGALRI